MREQRREAERLVGIFTASFYDTSSDAGWHQPSMLSRLIEFFGDIPPPSGFDQADLKMISEIRWVRSAHPDLPHARALMQQLSLEQQLVMVVHARLKGLVCAQTDSVWTERQMAGAISMELRAFQKHKDAGYTRLIGLMTKT